MGIDAIIERRRRQPQWDPDLWDFAERVHFVSRDELNDRTIVPRPLEHVSDKALQARLDAIDRNIQYLDVADEPRDDWPPEKGWLSPWWWLRLRRWTLSEFARRSLALQPAIEVAPPVPLHLDFLGIYAGKPPRMFRLSRLPYLMRFLDQRELRFVLDPGCAAAIAEGAYFMNIGSIADIAGVYDGDGRRIAGTGPQSWLA